jgi:hypothetical protein
MSDQGKGGPMILNFNWKNDITEQLLNYKSLTLEFVEEKFSKQELLNFLRFNLFDVDDDGKNKTELYIACNIFLCT